MAGGSGTRIADVRAAPVGENVFSQPARQRSVGKLDYFKVNQPAVGHDFAVPVPGGQEWSIVAINSLFTPSAVAASRYPALVITVDGLQVYNDPPAAAITAGGPVTVCWVAGTGTGSHFVDTGMLMSILSEPLPAGFVISTVTDNIDAGDQWSNIVVLLERQYVGGRDGDDE